MNVDQNENLEKPIPEEIYLYRDKEYQVIVDKDRKYFDVIEFPELECVNEHMEKLGYTLVFHLGNEWMRNVIVWGGRKLKHHRLIAHISLNDYGFTEIYFERTCDFLHWMNTELNWVNILRDQLKIDDEDCEKRRLARL